MVALDLRFVHLLPEIFRFKVKLSNTFATTVSGIENDPADVMVQDYQISFSPFTSVKGGEKIFDTLFLIILKGRKSTLQTLQ